MYKISSKGIWDSVICNMIGSVPDPDPVGSGPFWSDPDPDVWDQFRIRTRILTLINDPISTILVCVKAINTLGLPVD
jgi:hypothetical protein